VLIGAVFAISAFTKLRSRTALRSFASSLVMLPPRVRLPVGGALAAGEGAAVVLMAIPRVGLTLSGVLLCAFSAAIAFSVRRGLRVSCRCFGFAASQLGPVHLMRNGLLLAAVALGWTALTVPGDPPTVAGLAIAVPAGLVGAVIMVAFDDIADLFTEITGSA
jgi:hypothetical protein